MSAVSLAIGVVPVVLFLAALLLLDSYKLVTRRAVAISIGAGVIAALVCYAANFALLFHAHVPQDVLKRFIAPVIEECAKAAFVYALIRRGRVGFLVDAGIHGFAVGTGFALVENVYYASAAQDFTLAAWIVRGLGTAVMHGATTAVFGILGKALSDRRGSASFALFLPGLLIGVVIHSLFNHFVFSPLLQAGIVVALMPVLIVVVFDRSERSTRDWLGAGMDHDIELIEQILSGEVEHTRIGDYLHSLKEHFPGAVVADMLCYVRIHTELSIRAKGMLMARAAGFDVPVGDDVRANLEELRYLERAIGRTGLLAIHPFLRTSSRDLWQLYMLRGRQAVR